MFNIDHNHNNIEHKEITCQYAREKWKTWASMLGIGGTLKRFDLKSLKHVYRTAMLHWHPDKRLSPHVTSNRANGAQKIEDSSLCVQRLIEVRQAHSHVLNTLRPGANNLCEANCPCRNTRATSRVHASPPPPYTGKRPFRSFAQQSVFRDSNPKRPRNGRHPPPTHETNGTQTPETTTDAERETRDMPWYERHHSANVYSQSYDRMNAAHRQPLVERCGTRTVDTHVFVELGIRDVLNGCVRKLTYSRQEPCDACDAQTHVACCKCQSTRYVSVVVEENVRIAPGTFEGDSIVMRARSHRTHHRGHEPGDLVVRVGEKWYEKSALHKHVSPHDMLRNIHHLLPLFEMENEMKRRVHRRLRRMRGSTRCLDKMRHLFESEILCTGDTKTPPAHTSAIDAIESAGAVCDWSWWLDNASFDRTHNEPVYYTRQGHDLVLCKTISTKDSLDAFAFCVENIATASSIHTLCATHAARNTTDQTSAFAAAKRACKSVHSYTQPKLQSPQANYTKITRSKPVAAILVRKTSRCVTRNNTVLRIRGAGFERKTQSGHNTGLRKPTRGTLGGSGEAPKGDMLIRLVVTDGAVLDERRRKTLANIMLCEYASKRGSYTDMVNDISSRKRTGTKVIRDGADVIDITPCTVCCAQQATVYRIDAVLV